MKRRVFVPAAAVLLTVLSACARPSGAVEIPPEELPFSVARTPAPSPSSTPAVTVTVFFVQEGRLVEAARVVSRSLPSVEAAAQALLEGPTTQESLDGIDSTIPPQTSLLEARVLDQVADIDFSEEFQSPAEPEVIHLRIAQVVWTLVAIPGVTAVRFSIDGTPISVVTDRGAPVDRPVTAPDFASVAPPS